MFLTMAITTDIDLLKHLAAKGAIASKISTTTSDISKALNISQQSASRRVRALASSGVIFSNPTPKGIELTITENGRDILQDYLAELKGIMVSKLPARLEGKVVSGVGEGKYYVLQPNYNAYFKKILCSRVYAGTLNLATDSLALKQFISQATPGLFEAFETPERSFGALRTYAVRINGTQKGALVIPERTVHTKDTVEIIAPVNLRKKFSLKDNDVVEIELIEKEM